MMSTMGHVSTFATCKQKLPLLHDMQKIFNPKEKVVVVMGPTGAGKSRLSIDIAGIFSGEVVNSDKMQVYKGYDVVTNKVTEEETRGIPHHLLGVIDPDDDFEAADFCSATERCVRSIVGRGHRPIIAGGSNSFIEAFVDGDVSTVSKGRDSYPYQPCYPNFTGTGIIRPSISGIEHKLYMSRYEFCFLWVDVTLPVLHGFVSDRVDRMVDRGMIEELRMMFNPDNHDYSRGLRKAIGMKEFDRYFRTELTRAQNDVVLGNILKDAIKEVKSNTRELASRQREKIRRLKYAKGWNIHRIDATQVFLMRRGGAADVAWDELVVAPCAAIVNKFLCDRETSLFFSPNDAVLPSHAVRRSIAAAVH